MNAMESQLRGKAIVSLQTGQPVAVVAGLVIDRSSLEIRAFVCQLPSQPRVRLLLDSDIRQITNDCLIINDEDDLSETEDIVRLSGLIEEAYSPRGKGVISDTGRRLGRVTEFNINLISGRIQQIFVRPPLWRGWFSSQLIIDRSQIVDVSIDRIIVRDSTIPDTVLSPDSLPTINP
jgi:sporulation protein YlmC with PRC-barrel domain